MARLIRTDGTESVVEPKDLKEMQALVGGYIEFVHLDDGSAIMINENGKIHDLPFNAIATDLAGPCIFGWDHLVGDCVHFSAEEMKAMESEE